MIAIIIRNDRKMHRVVGIIANSYVSTVFVIKDNNNRDRVRFKKALF